MPEIRIHGNAVTVIDDNDDIVSARIDTTIQDDYVLAEIDGSILSMQTIECFWAVLDLFNAPHMDDADYRMELINNATNQSVALVNIKDMI